MLLGIGRSKRWTGERAADDDDATNLHEGGAGEEHCAGETCGTVTGLRVCIHVSRKRKAANEAPPSHKDSSTQAHGWHTVAEASTALESRDGRGAKRHTPTLSSRVKGIHGGAHLTTARNPYIEDAFHMRESPHMNSIRAGERMEGGVEEEWQNDSKMLWDKTGTTKT